jgi:hypothetical protein
MAVQHVCEGLGFIAGLAGTYVGWASSRLAGWLCCAVLCREVASVSAHHMLLQAAVFQCSLAALEWTMLQ